MDFKPMTRRFVSDLKDGEVVDEVFLVSDKQLRANRNADKANNSNAQSVTPVPTASASKQGGLLSNVTGNGSGNGSAQASASADSGGIDQVAGSALQGARSSAAPAAIRCQRTCRQVSSKARRRASSGSSEGWVRSR